MTPEQLASQPTHEAPVMEVIRDANIRLSRMQTVLRAVRVHRHSLEYPPGHDMRKKLPTIVAEWEKEHGTAPESAIRFLGIE